MGESRIEASVLGGIRGDNDTFGGLGFVVEKAALEADLLWVGIDNKWVARCWIIWSYIGGNLSWGSGFQRFWEFTNRLGDRVHQNS
jgi:hypothetical protein